MRIYETYKKGYCLQELIKFFLKSQENNGCSQVAVVFRASATKSPAGMPLVLTMLSTIFSIQSIFSRSTVNCFSLMRILLIDRNPNETKLTRFGLLESVIYTKSASLPGHIVWHNGPQGAMFCKLPQGSLLQTAHVKLMS